MSGDSREIETLRSDLAQGLFHVEGKPLSLANYPMYLAIYDGLYPRLLLKTGRQVAKTVQVSSKISMADGSFKRAQDIEVGDVVATMAVDGYTMTTSRVTWVSEVYRKKSRRITTRQGHVVDVAQTHPMRAWNAWKKAGHVNVGDRLAVVRACGDFSDVSDVPIERVRLTAYLIGDGYIADDISFTQVPGATLDEFLADLTRAGGSGSVALTKSKASTIRLHREGPVHAWMKEDGLDGSRSATKFVPPWVFGLSREDTAVFLNRLWSTDGHVKLNDSSYAIGYSSISKTLIDQVRALLWKFGIPTSARSWIPPVYEGTGKVAYSIRVETQDGARTFLTEVGCLGKAEAIALPTNIRENSNRDSFPIEINELITEIIDSRGGHAHAGSLHSVGLRCTLKHAPSRKKLRKFVDHFRANPAYDQGKVDVLEGHANTDLFWDVVTKIDEIGVQPCIDFEVADTHSFIANGFVTHNSTTAACFMIAGTVGVPHFKTYYVSPSQEQTRKFSHTRISKILAYSPEIRRHFVGPESIDNVLLRMLRNGSEMAFTYALDNPDRARGYSADLCVFDEVQDILYEPVVPVIEECFDQAVEVLTRTGWKKVANVTLEDEIADVNDAGNIEWHVPSQLIHKTYTGDMVSFAHDGVALRVTANHMMWADRNGEARKMEPNGFEFVTAGELAASQRECFRVTGPGEVIAGTAPAVRRFEGIEGAHGANRVGIEMPYDAFARLTGWFIAEGCVRWVKKDGKKVCPRPCITQSEGRYLDEIIETIRACGLTYSIAANSKKPHIKHVYINSRLLGEYFVSLGKTADKYIPDEFFQYPSLLLPLLEAVYLGDATKRENATWDTWTLFTVSPRLADDVHRAWTMLGRSPRVREKPYVTKKTQIDKVGYEVCAYAQNFLIFYKRQQRVTVAAVKAEPVFCFTVPHHRPVVRGGAGQRPVVTSQCMANSKYAYSMYTGTPKTMENSIEFLWSLSTQTEWCIRCAGCNKSTFIDNIKPIGLNGPVCLNCGKYINPRDGRWVDMKPGARIKGFHISQQIMPENVPAAWNPSDPEYAKAAERWQRILNKLEEWGEVKFLNESIGVSTSTGARLLTKEILESMCDESHEMTRLPLPGGSSVAGMRRIVAGVDWSGGGQEVKGSEGVIKSRTVLHIYGATEDGRLKTLYYKIFPNGHMTNCIEEIVELCNAWGVQMICGDAGEGQLANAMLRKELGDHRVIQMRYMALSKPVDWNPNTLCYHVDRTTMIDNYALFLTHQQAKFPKLTQMMPAINDILNVYEETTTQGKKVWRHSPTAPDDCLHAQVFSWFAWKVLSQDLRFY